MPVLNIVTITNNPISSNCFILYESNNRDCIIVDPGTKNNVQLHDFLEKFSLSPKYIILTHEHFDHIWGVSNLKNRYPKIKVLCSQLCSELIQNRKRNLSIYYDEVGFEIQGNNVHVEDINFEFDWFKRKIRFFSTPGHTDASISFIIDNNLFVGDLIMDKNITVTNLPHGNKEKLKNSLRSLINLFENQVINVFSGHGSIFLLSDVFHIPHTLQRE